MTYEIHAEALWLIPVVFAVIFMLWAIWELEKQIRLEKRRSNALALSETRSEQPLPKTPSEDRRSSARAAQLQFR
jgi:hypothetical protein